MFVDFSNAFGKEATFMVHPYSLTEIFICVKKMLDGAKYIVWDRGLVHYYHLCDSGLGLQQ